MSMPWPMNTREDTLPLRHHICKVHIWMTVFTKPFNNNNNNNSEVLLGAKIHRPDAPFFFKQCTLHVSIGIECEQ